MRLSQHKIKWLARLMLGLVLFMQGIVAVNACVAQSPAQVYTMAPHDDAAMPCHDEETPNANACLSHCTLPDQISVDQYQMPAVAPSKVMVRLNLQPQTPLVRPDMSFEHLALDTGPPISVRFCTFLN